MAQMNATSVGNLAVWHHPTAGRPIARVLLVHGISEHSGRHLPTVQALVAKNIEVVRLDLRGAGQSGGRRQWISSFNDYVADVAAVHGWIGAKLPELPLFVLGHSLGGAISVYFTRQYGPLLRGLILSAPAHLPGRALGPVKIFVGKLLAPLLPTFRLYSSRPEALSRRPEVAEAYRQDPLAFRFNTLQQGRLVLEALARVPETAQAITTPTLIAHGTHDTVILPEGSFAILRALASRSKELHYLPGVYHEPHLDLGAEAYFGLVTRWIAQRSA